MRWTKRAAAPSKELNCRMKRLSTPNGCSVFVHSLHDVFLHQQAVDAVLAHVVHQHVAIRQQERRQRRAALVIESRNDAFKVVLSSSLTQKGFSVAFRCAGSNSINLLPVRNTYRKWSKRLLLTGTPQSAFYQCLFETNRLHQQTVSGGQPHTRYRLFSRGEIVRCECPPLETNHATIHV